MPPGRAAGREAAEPAPSVLHLLAPGPVGGLEAVVRTLAREQTRRGTDVHVGAVVEPEAVPHSFVEKTGGDGVPVTTLEVPHRRYLAEVREVRGLLERVDPGVVHTHGYRADVVEGTVARRAGRPVVSTVHGFTGGGLKNRVFEWLQRRSLRAYDAVVAVSRPMAAGLREDGVEPDRIHVVPNAWDPGGRPLEREEARRELDLPPDEYVLGWVGRLSSEKGPDVFLRAVAELAADGRDVAASVVGEGPRRAELEEMGRELGIGDSVRFHGLVPDAAELYRAFDVFVLSSRTEGTPVSLFEAVHARVPVVATRVGGVPDVVGPEEAKLVSPEDPAALARAVADVRRRPDLARERSRSAARRLEEEFSVEPWLERYASVYRAAVASSGPTTSG